MTSRPQRHLRQAQHSSNVALALSRGQSPISCQWAVVCLFYAGIHYVNAYLSTRGSEIPEDHGTRVGLVHRHMRGTLKQFKSLKFESERARYKMKYYQKRHVEGLQKKLDDIRDFVLRKLPQDQQVH